MLGDIRQAKSIYIVCGYTDMWKGINSLVPFIQQNYQMDPYSNGLFLFCGKRRDRIKALLWEPDGFVLLYKRLSNGSYQWPRTPAEVKITDFDSRVTVFWRFNVITSTRQFISAYFRWIKERKYHQSQPF